MIEIATIVACIVLFALSLFQLSLIFGAPLGKYAWGGVHTVLPKRLRIASSVSLLLYATFAVFILSKAGIIDNIINQNLVDIGMWVFTGYFFLGIIMNGISRSKPEHSLMTPVAAALAMLFLVVAIG